ncbi:MAG: class I SAM-dependent methyltransferase [Caldilineaceae bacterium]
MATTFQQEVARGERFQFGANWQRFLTTLTEERIVEAVVSLKEWLGVETLQGQRFLDIGSGSGLFSLAAKRLGATVYSFDYDPQSVACTQELKRRFFPQDATWTIVEGSILDEAFVQSLGQFDIVYSWGVLHHTGQMWQALANAGQLVAPNGKLFIAIYNDQGSWSRRWKKLKAWYNRLPAAARPLFALAVMGGREAKFILIALVRFNLGDYIRTWTAYGQGSRGMSKWHDLIDWIGGYPFEVAKPEEIFAFYYERGFTLAKLKTCGGGVGCNEFVFVK